MSNAMEGEIAHCFIEQKMALPDIVKHIKQKYGMEPDPKMILRALSVELQQNIIFCSAVLNMSPAQMQPYIGLTLHLPVTIEEIDKVVNEFHANIIYQGVHRQLSIPHLRDHIQDVFHVLVPDDYIIQVIETHQQEYGWSERAEGHSSTRSSPIPSSGDIWMDEAERVVPLKTQRMIRRLSKK